MSLNGRRRRTQRHDTRCRATIFIEDKPIYWWSDTGDLCRTALHTADRHTKMTNSTTITEDHLRVLQEADNPAAPVAQLILRVESHTERSVSATVRNGQDTAAD